METSDYHRIALNLSPSFHALSHPARVQIMLHLAKYNGCQAGSISGKMPLAKSTVSEHLSKLKEAGLITCVNDGTCSNYRISYEALEQVKMYFKEFLDLIEQRQAKRTDCCAINSDGDLLFSNK